MSVPLEEALRVTPFGRFQYLLLIVCGAANAADSVEILAVSFILPSAEKDLNLSSQEKGYLTAMIFVGMMFGSWLWGNWADQIGRRVTLSLALFFNGLFGVISAFAPSFIWLLLFRFAAGFGVGGSIPIVFSYFAEFFTSERRSSYLIYLAMFWMVGGIFASGMAWWIIPNEVQIWGLHSWRVFLIVCGLPSLFTSLALLWFPESPEFLLSRGRISETARVLSQITSTNGGAADMGELELILRDSKRCSESAGSPTRRAPSNSSERVQLLSNAGGNTPSASETGDSPLSSPLNSPRSCTERATYFWSHAVAVFHDPLYRKSAFLLTFVWFTLSFGFYGMTMWLPSYLKGRSSFSEYTTVFLDNVANLPGSLASLYLVKRFGAGKTLAISMGASGISLLGFLVVASSDQVLVASMVFAAVSVGGWNALNILSTHLFPPKLRSTSFGTFAAFGRIGAIAANIMFGFLLHSNAAIPIVVVVSCFILGSVATMALPKPIEEGKEVVVPGHAA